MAPVQKAFTTQQEASLFYAARQGSSKAMDQLISSYMPLAVFLASRISGVSPADIAALMIWLHTRTERGDAT